MVHPVDQGGFHGIEKRFRKKTHTRGFFLRDPSIGSHHDIGHGQGRGQSKQYNEQFQPFHGLGVFRKAVALAPHGLDERFLTDQFGNFLPQFEDMDIDRAGLDVGIRVVPDFREQFLL